MKLKLCAFLCAVAVVNLLLVLKADLMASSEPSFMASSALNRLSSVMINPSANPSRYLGSIGDAVTLPPVVGCTLRSWLDNTGTALGYTAAFDADGPLALTIIKDGKKAVKPFWDLQQNVSPNFYYDWSQFRFGGPSCDDVTNFVKGLNYTISSVTLPPVVGCRLSDWLATTGNTQGYTAAFDADGPLALTITKDGKKAVKPFWDLQQNVSPNFYYDWSQFRFGGTSCDAVASFMNGLSYSQAASVQKVAFADWLNQNYASKWNWDGNRGRVLVRGFAVDPPLYQSILSSDGHIYGTPDELKSIIDQTLPPTGNYGLEEYLNMYYSGQWGITTTGSYYITSSSLNGAIDTSSLRKRSEMFYGTPEQIKAIIDKALAENNIPQRGFAAEPSVTTTAPMSGSVYSTTAVLRGDIDGQGSVINYWFDYCVGSENSGNCKQTPHLTLPSSQTGEVSDLAGGLAENTKYSYRLNGSVGGFNVTGAWKNFTTPYAGNKPGTLVKVADVLNIRFSGRGNYSNGTLFIDGKPLDMTQFMNIGSHLYATQDVFNTAVSNAGIK